MHRAHNHKRLTYWRKAKKYYRQNRLVATICLACLIVIIVGSSCLALVLASKNQPTNKAATATIKPVKNQRIASTNKPTATTPANNDTQASDSQTTTPNTKTTTPTAPSKTPANTTAKYLSASPTVFYAKQGEAPTITLTASGDAAVNMPGFTTSNGGKFMFNFAAGPAKNSWTGPIMVYRDAPVGDYPLEITAQDRSTAYYRTNITIHVVKPTVSITANFVNYDPVSDVLYYAIHLNRQYGFSEPVVGLTGHSVNEQNFYCYLSSDGYDVVGASCVQSDPEGPRPTNGTVSFSVSTATTFNETTTSYNLPPL